MNAAARGLLSRPEDAHCVVYHLTVVAAYLAAFWMWLDPELSGLTGPWHKAVFVAAAAPLLGWISGIDVGVNYHNHAHRPIFTRPAWNRWFERIWTPFCAWPARYWAHLHVAVHHAHLLSEADWTVRQRRRDGQYESCLRYQLRCWPWRPLRHFPRDVRAGRFSGRVAAVELFWFLAVWSIPFLVDPVMGLCLWLLPHWCGNCITMGRGMFVQHAGCEGFAEDRRLPHSNDFAAPFYNATMFNIGFHGAHHDFPGRHWTELPALAAQLAALAAAAPAAPAPVAAGTTSRG